MPGGTVGARFGDARHFALITVRGADRTAEAQEILANAWRGEARTKGIRVAEWLIAHKSTWRS
jgi:hypothetical protein